MSRTILSILILAGVALGADTTLVSAQDSLYRKSFVPVRDLDSLIADTLAARLQPGPKDSALRVKSDTASDSATAKQDSAVAPAQNPATDGAALRGQILSGDEGKSLAEATILLQRDSVRLSTQSDEGGLYRLTGIPPGAWKLSVFRKGYEARSEILDEFTRGEDRFLEIRLERRVAKGQLIQAKSEGSKAGSAQDLLAKRQKAAAVMEGVSAEQIAKTTDSDAGAVARRITGTSLVGGKYVYVRGLGERYTNMSLNGLPVPSPEKDKRVVPQDLFPAGALESFAIYKTFTPELYSDFAGGSVALVTKGIPEKPFFKVSMTSGNHYHARVDSADILSSYRGMAPVNGQPVPIRPGGWQGGNTRLTYDGGNTFWGFDDGTRSLPDGFPTVIPKNMSADDAVKAREEGLPGYGPEERAGFATSLPNVYKLDTGRVRAPVNLAISAANIYPAAGGGKFGFLAHAGFKNKYDQFLVQRQTIAAGFAYTQDTVFIPRLNRTDVVTRQLYDSVPTDTGIRIDKVRILKADITSQTDQGTYEAQLSGMMNMRYENPDWSVWWKNFAVNIGTDKALNTRSYQNKAGGGIITQDKGYEDRYMLEFSRRSLVTSQVGGEAYVGKNILDSVAWAAGLSAVTGETPDSRRYMYFQASPGLDVAPTFQNNDIWGTRIFESMDEKAVAGRMDAFLAIPPEFSARDTFFTDSGYFSDLALPTFASGFAGNARSRTFDATRYSYDKDRRPIKGLTLEQVRDPENLGPDILDGTSDFATSPKNYDTYDATEVQVAGYLSSAVSARLLRMPAGLDGGTRLEWYDFHLRAPFTGLDADQEDLTANVREWNAYSTVGAWVKPFTPLRLRLQFAQTGVRPEIREVAPFQYSDFISGRTIEGNPKLKRTNITHYDARADLYLPFQQSLSASLFYKDFTDPVEATINQFKEESYQNASGAYVKGVEFEAILSPGRLLDSWDLGTRWLQDLQISGNIALMRSRVRLRNTSSSLDITNYNRPLVGQAPYLINASVTHEAKAGPFALLNAVLFNVAGERIRFTGTNALPDIYEKPFASLESLHRITAWKRTELSVKVKNWLMQSKEWRVRESNDKIRYHSVTPAQFQQVFGNVERYQTTERIQDAISVEINFSRQL
jgi:hypothetical protein